MPPKKAIKKTTNPAAKGKKVKDPNAPKRPLSAYFEYTAGRRAGLIKENPGIAFGEVGKKLGAEWKELSDAKKKPYQDTAAKSKVAYDKKKAAYDAKK